MESTFFCGRMRSARHAGRGVDTGGGLIADGRLVEPLEPCKSESVFLGDESNDLTDNPVWLGKKSRLSGPILRAAKVTQADANQAKPLVRSEADTL